MPAERGAIEFSRPLRLGLVGPEGREERLEATAAECAALARRFGIPAMASLCATLCLVREEGGTVLARGTVSAAVTQDCVVTLDPVDQAVEAPLLLRFLGPGRVAADGPDDPDEIETTDGMADLGEAVAEQLALALDPYPRAPGAALPLPEDDPAPAPAAGAFAALARRRG